MILNRSISQRHNRKPAQPVRAWQSLNVRPVRVSLATYSITARQVRNACVVGCVAGLVFVATVCIFLP